MKKKYFHILLTTMLALILTGCVSKQDYPSTWSEIDVSTSTCPKISGTYSNYGDRADSTYKPVLSSLFGLNVVPPDYVRLELIRDSLIVSTSDAEQKTTSTTLSFEPEHLYCENGFLVVEKGKFQNREGALGQEWQTYVFSINDDGLVLNETNSAVGMLFFIPIAGSHSSWTLFANKPN